MSERRHNVELPHNQTCQWISDLDEYKNWRAAPRGLLWIKGKPGSGKSTLMSHLYSSVFKQNGESDVKLEFFFSARGAPLQRKPLGMLRSLLNQIFYQDHNVRNLLRELFRNKCASFGNSKSSWEWQQAELKKLFLEMVSISAQNHQITIFIDALDEAGKHAAQDTAEYFHRVNETINEQRGSVRICISCRHYPIPSIARTTEIHVEQYNEKDIETFVRDSLHLHDPSPKLMVQPQSWLTLINDLVKMAHGVFQWIKLVIPWVVGWISDGDTLAEIRERLTEVPKELGEMYKHIIEHVIDRRYRTRSLRLFQWVALAIYPLSVTAMRDAIAALDMETTALGLQFNQTTSLLESQGDMRLRIRSWSGGMVEVIDYGDEYNPEPVIQVIHQSVNDFLTEIGLSILIALNDHVPQERLTENSLLDSSKSIQISHGALYSSCLKVLCVKATEIDSNPQQYWHLQGELLHDQHPFTFVRYASFHCLQHAENAKTHRGHDLGNESLLLSRALALLRNFRNSRDSHLEDGRDYLFYANTTILHVAAAAGLEDLVYFRLGSHDDPHAEDKFGWTALHFAVETCHLGVANILFNVGADVHKTTKHGSTPLLLAASRGHAEVFKWLMARGADLTASNSNTESVLYAAAAHSRLLICKLCIDAGIDVNTPGGKRGNALQAAAAANSGEDMVRLLLKAGAKVNIQGGEYGNALQAAASNSKMEVVQLLLEAGANVNAQGGHHGNALQAAAYRGSEEIVKLLLDAGADVHERGGEHGSALQAAASGYKNDKNVIRLLLNAGADVNAQVKVYGSALQSVAQRGDDEAVQLLLGAGANVNAQGGYCGNALQAAAFDSDERTLRLLLEAGAEVNAQGGIYGNALQAAALSRSHGKESVRLLLEAGANVHAQGGEYGNALQAAAYANNKETVQLLLEAGADIKLKENRYGYALQAATAGYKGDLETVKLLLEAGADVNAKGGEFGYALHTAAQRKDSIELVRLLLEAGANVNARGGRHESALQSAVVEANRDDCNVEVIQLLLEAGADVNARGGIFGSPLGAALTDRTGRLTTILREAGATHDEFVHYPTDDEWWTALFGNRETGVDSEEADTHVDPNPASIDETPNPPKTRKGRGLLRKLNRLLLRQ